MGERLTNIVGGGGAGKLNRFDHQVLSVIDRQFNSHV